MKKRSVRGLNSTLKILTELSLFCKFKIYPKNTPKNPNKPLHSKGYKKKIPQKKIRHLSLMYKYKQKRPKIQAILSLQKLCKSVTKTPPPITQNFSLLQKNFPPHQKYFFVQKSANFFQKENHQDCTHIPSIIGRNLRADCQG